MWDLRESEIEPVSPTLASWFFITEPPRKPADSPFQHPATFFLSSEQDWKSPEGTISCVCSPWCSAVKNWPAEAGDLGWIPGWGSSPGEGNGNPLLHPCLENPMDRRAERATVHGVTGSRTRLSGSAHTTSHMCCHVRLISRALQDLWEPVSSGGPWGRDGLRAHTSLAHSEDCGWAGQLLPAHRAPWSRLGKADEPRVCARRGKRTVSMPAFEQGLPFSRPVQASARQQGLDFDPT